MRKVLNLVRKNFSVMLAILDMTCKKKSENWENLKEMWGKFDRVGRKIWLICEEYLYKL